MFLVFVTCVCRSALASAHPFIAVVSGTTNGICYILPAPFGIVEWIGPDRLDDGRDVSAIASGNGRDVFASLHTRSGQTHVVRLTPDGKRTPFFVSDSIGAGGGIAVSSGGRVVVLVWSQATSSMSFAVISPTGVLEALYPTAGAVEIAFGNDDCTLFYVAGRGVERFNVCTGKALTPFTTIPSQIFDVRPLSSGEVLVSTGPALDLYDGNGTRLRRMASVDGRHQLIDEVALGPDGRSLWIAAMSYCGQQSDLIQLSSDDGRELYRRRLFLDQASGLVAGHSISAIPVSSRSSLLLFVLTVAVLGVLRLRIL